MYVAKCEIRIGTGQQMLRFNRATSIEIRKSVHFLTDTAVIQLPTTAVMKNRRAKAAVEVAKEIQAGMPVEIKVWYRQYQSEAILFRGYVVRVDRKTPVEIECEDNIGLLRYRNVNKDWSETTLEQVLREITQGSPLELAPDIPSVNLKSFYLKNKNGLEALQKIKEEFGFSVYLNREGKLYCGVAYEEDWGKVRYHLNGNSVDVVSADNLRWQDKEDVRLCVKAVAVKEDNSCIVAQAGDTDGAVKTKRFYNVEGKEELQAIAEQELGKLKFDGYRGKLTAFLIPGVLPGMTAEIKDEKYPEREGSYFVESVTTTFGRSGCRNRIEIGRRKR